MRMTQNPVLRWCCLSGVRLPCLVRAGEAYVSVRMVEKKLLVAYPDITPSDGQTWPRLASYYVTSSEVDLLNAICTAHPYYKLTDQPFTTDDVLVKFTEFEEFLEAVQSYFGTLHERDDISDVHKEQNEPFVVGGWVQLNNSAVPFVLRHDTKFVPLGVVKYATGLLTGVEVTGYDMTLAECSYLNQCCAEANLNFMFTMRKTRLLPLPLVSQLSEQKVQLRTLPKHDPFAFAEPTSDSFHGASKTAAELAENGTDSQHNETEKKELSTHRSFKANQIPEGKRLYPLPSPRICHAEVPSKIQPVPNTTPDKVHVENVKQEGIGVQHLDSKPYDSKEMAVAQILSQMTSSVREPASKKDVQPMLPESSQSVTVKTEPISVLPEKTTLSSANLSVPSSNLTEPPQHMKHPMGYQIPDPGIDVKPVLDAKPFTAHEPPSPSTWYEATQGVLQQSDSAASRKPFILHNLSRDMPKGVKRIHVPDTHDTGIDLKHVNLSLQNQMPKPLMPYQVHHEKAKLDTSRMALPMAHQATEPMSTHSITGQLNVSDEKPVITNQTPNSLPAYNKPSGAPQVNILHGKQPTAQQTFLPSTVHQLEQMKPQEHVTDVKPSIVHQPPHPLTWRQVAHGVLQRPSSSDTKPSIPCQSAPVVSQEVPQGVKHIQIPMSNIPGDAQRRVSEIMQDQISKIQLERGDSIGLCDSGTTPLRQLLLNQNQPMHPAPYTLTPHIPKRRGRPPKSSYPTKVLEKPEAEVRFFKMGSKIVGCLVTASGRYSLLQILHRVYFAQTDLMQFLHYIKNVIGIRTFIPSPQDQVVLGRYHSLTPDQIVCPDAVDILEFESHLSMLYKIIFDWEQNKQHVNNTATV